MQYMCRQGGAPDSNMGKTLLYTEYVLWQFHKHTQDFSYMVIFIHGSFELSVTTVEKQARMT